MGGNSGEHAHPDQMGPLRMRRRRARVMKVLQYIEKCASPAAQPARRQEPRSGCPPPTMGATPRRSSIAGARPKAQCYLVAADFRESLSVGPTEDLTTISRTFDHDRETLRAGGGGLNLRPQCGRGIRRAPSHTSTERGSVTSLRTFTPGHFRGR